MKLNRARVVSRDDAVSTHIRLSSSSFTCSRAQLSLSFRIGQNRCSRSSEQPSTHAPAHFLLPALPPDHALQSAILATGGWSEARVIYVSSARTDHSGTEGVCVERCIHLAVGDQEEGECYSIQLYLDEPEAEQ